MTSENSTPLGKNRPSSPLAFSFAPGELVYAVGDLVQTRRWTWRQSENGKVDASTTRVVFPIDGFVGVNDDAVRAACDELAAHLRDDLGAQASVALASADAPDVCA